MDAEAEIFSLLEKRCKVRNCQINRLGNKHFQLIHSNRIITFKGNLNSGSSFIDTSFEQLSSLYEPDILFDVFSIFSDLKVKTGFNFCIVNDHLEINCDLEKSKNLEKNFFLQILEKFDKIDQKEKPFKIQFVPDDTIAINRCIKVSLWTLEKFLKFDILESLIDLTHAYFKCFFNAPVCCEMQSMVHVYDYQFFSYFYMQYCKNIIFEIVKILFPFIEKIEMASLERKYLEIIPVALIKSFYHDLGDLLQKLKRRSDTERDNQWRTKYLHEILKHSCIKFDTGKSRLANSMEVFEKREGIALYLENKVIGTAEYFSSWKNSDYCYFCKSDMSNFLRMMNVRYKNGLSGLHFTVTEYGLIRFNSCCEILPSIFLKVKKQENVTLLLAFIKEISVRTKLIEKKALQSLNPDLSLLSVLQEDKNEKDPYAIRKWKQYKSSKENLIKIAKLFNRTLENIGDNLFELEIFGCVPEFIYHIPISDQKLILDALQKMEIDFIRTKMLSNDLFLINGWMDTRNHLINASSNYENVIKLLQLNEVINSDFKNQIISLKQGKIFLMPEQTRVQDESEIFSKCLNIIKKFGQKVMVLENILVFNNSLLIDYSNFLMISNRNMLNFFEMAKLYSELCLSAEVYHCDSWLCLDEIKPELRDSCWEVVKIVNSLFESKESEIRQNYQGCLKLIPRNLIPPIEFVYINGVNCPEKFDCWQKYALNILAKTLKSLKSQIQLSFRSDGVLGTIISIEHPSKYSIQLPASKWLLIKDIQTFLKLHHKICEFQDGYYLHADGFLNNFAVENFVREGCTETNKEEYQELAKNMITSVRNNTSENHHLLPLTLDSTGRMMIGHFIWILIDMPLEFIPKVLEIVQIYEDAMHHNEPDLMKSVDDFGSNKSKTYARKIVKIINKVFDEKMMIDNLKVLPRSLFEEFEKCQNKDAMYQKIKKIFDEFNKRELLWSIDLNGNFVIDHWMTVTFKHLINIESFETFAKLVKKVQEPKERYNLFSEESLFYARKKEQRVFRTIHNVSEVFDARKKSFELEEKLRVDSTLALLLAPDRISHANLWMDPEDFHGKQGKTVSDIFEITKLIKTAFKQDQIFRFQLAHSDFPLLTFSNEQQRFEQYSENLEKHLNNMGVISFSKNGETFFINNILHVHPRTFFHLPDVASVMRELKEENEEILDENESKKNIQTFLQNLGKAFYEKKSNFVNSVSCKLKMEQSENYGIANIEIKNKKIFAPEFVNCLSNAKLKHKPNVCALGLRLVTEKNVDCENAQDFIFILDIVNDFCSGKNMDENGKLIMGQKKEDDQSLLLKFLNMGTSGVEATNSESKLKLFWILHGQSYIKGIKSETPEITSQESIRKEVEKFYINNRTKIEEFSEKIGKKNKLYGIKRFSGEQIGDLENSNICKIPNNVLDENGEIIFTEDIFSLAKAISYHKTTKCDNIIDFIYLLKILTAYCNGIELTKENEECKLITGRTNINPSIITENKQNDILNELKHFVDAQLQFLESQPKEELGFQSKLEAVRDWIMNGTKYGDYRSYINGRRSEKEAKIIKRLIIIKGRIEFNRTREYVLKKVGQVFWKKLPMIEIFSSEIKNQINCNEIEKHGIENITVVKTVNGEIKKSKIFAHGITIGMLDDKDEEKLNFSDDMFILGLKVIHHEIIECENIFDYVSVLEILKVYCNGVKISDTKKLVKNKNDSVDPSLLINDTTDNGDYNNMVQFFKEQMNEIKNIEATCEFKFKSPLKGLHHWLKHGETFPNLKDYYEKMNMFFRDNKIYTIEFDAQNGIVIIRNFKSSEYFGSLIFDDPENFNPLCVTTFYKNK